MGGCNPQNDRIEQLYHEIYDRNIFKTHLLLNAVIPTV